jgi:hypothetical protein
MSRRAACSPAPIALYLRAQFGHRGDGVLTVALHFGQVLVYVSGSGRAAMRGMYMFFDTQGRVIKGQAREKTKRVQIS